MTPQILFLNISIELAGVLMSLMVLTMLLITARLESRTRRYFFWIFSLLLALTASTLAGHLLLGHPGQTVRVIRYVALLLEFTSEAILPVVLAHYLLFCIDTNEDRFVVLHLLLLLIPGVQLVLLLVSQFTGNLYYLDAENVYQRGPQLDSFMLLSALSVLLCMILLVVYRDSLSTRQKFGFSVYLVLPAIAMIIQARIYGLQLVVFSCILSGLLLFLFILVDQTEKYYQKEQENADMRVAIMISQIQPHFLYNTLDSIYYLCGKDPKAAQQAISAFSDYLRGNMRSLSVKNPVPFRAERRHVETYLELEKMSSGDELSYSFDCQTEGFFLPPLTLQPLVENAVKHGIEKKSGGGTVQIRTRQDGDRVRIEVEDDGVGFDPAAPLSQDRQHIGIDNVRKRLDSLCGGTLEIKSRPGQGTLAVITLPQQKK